MIIAKNVIRTSARIPLVTANGIGNYVNANAGKLILNGRLVEIDNTVNFGKRNLFSSISITSGFDLRAVIFTIVGYNNNVLVTETLSGPNNNTVYTNNLFNKVLSISISNVINDVFTIGAFYDVLVASNYTFDSFNINSGASFYTLTSRDVAADWQAVNAVIYAKYRPAYNIYLKSNFVVATRDPSLDIIIGGLDNITAINLRRGISNNLTSNSLFFFITNGLVNQADSTINIEMQLRFN